MSVAIITGGGGGGALRCSKTESKGEKELEENLCTAFVRRS